MDKFSYHSEQVHTVVKNGYSNTRHNIVNIKNGKGEKIILKKQNDKNLTKKKKRLTKKEISKIRKNQFIPELFRSI
jgi:hypothetical protein